MKVLRPQPQPTPAPARPAPPSDRPRTAAGAPLERPREIPKTGEAERIREAIRLGMSKQTRYFHEGISAKAQDQFNKETRAHQDMVRRRLDDDIIESLRRIREEGLRMEREERYQRGRDEANARRMRETADKLRRTDQQQAPLSPEGMFKARREAPTKAPAELGQGKVVDEFPRGRHKLTIEEGDELLRRARKPDEQP